MEDGNLLVNGFKGNNRSAACLMAFFMKFFGWSFNQALAHLTKSRPTIFFKPNAEVALRQYEAELRNLTTSYQMGRPMESALISNFQSSMKPCFITKAKQSKFRKDSYYICKLPIPHELLKLNLQLKKASEKNPPKLFKKKKL